MSEQFPDNIEEDRQQKGRDLATLVYLIQAIALFTGVPFFIAVVVNYVKRGDVRGTLAESHFRWQIRTFWFWLLWTAIGTILLIILVGWVFIGIAWIWAVYRVVRGWLRLADNRPAY